MSTACNKSEGEIKMVEDFNIIVAGIGGQGNVLASRIIGEAAIDAGYHVLIGETFGAGQRGGAVLSHVRLIKEKSYGPLIPEGCADAVIGLEPFEALKCASKFLKKDGIIVTNEYPVMPSDKNYPDVKKIFDALKKISSKLYTLDGTKIALDIGDVATLNIVMLGAAHTSGILPVKEEHLKKAIKERLAKSADLNIKAFDKGKKLVKQK
jgi:indolepyruvate ferredoxin oxidoreductase, beta subunit